MKRLIHVGFLTSIFVIILASCSSVNQQDKLIGTATEKPTKANTATPEPSATAIQEPTPKLTATPELFQIVVQAFHDWNGNEEMDEGEPVLEGIVNTTGDYKCVTDAEGICELGMIP